MARSFNGSTDRIDYGNVDATVAQAQTFHCKIYSNNTPTGDEFFFVRHTSGDSSFSPIIQFDGSALGMQINYTGTTFKRYSGASAFPDATWFDFILTWDGSITATNCHLYVDNVEVSYGSTQNASGTQQTPSGSWTLGGWLLGDGPNLDGRLADIGWWNRVITADERGILAAAYTPKFILNGLKFAPDLIRNQRDIISGQTGTLDGTTVSEHPRIINPFGPQVASPTVAPVVAGGIMTCNTGYWGAI